MPPSKKKILIVEDEKDHLDGIAEFLKSRYIISTASNLIEARQKLSEKPFPNCVLADVRLNAMDSTNQDGLIFLEEVKSKHARIPVIITTGHEIYQSKAIRSGKRLKNPAANAFDVLYKPLSLEHLLDVIEAAILSSGQGSGFWKALKKLANRWLPTIMVFVMFLFLWEFVCRVFQVKEYLVPAPSRVYDVLHTQFTSLMSDTAITMAESVLGFGIANILSMLIAVGFCHSSWFEKSFYPYTIALKSVPVVAIAPLLVLWFGYGLLGKVIMAAIISFFPLVVNATIGLKAVNSESLDLMHSLSASKTQILFKLRFPSAMPYIFSALKISSALSVVGAIVGEMTGAKKGIGFLILISSYNVDTPLLFASIVLASLAGILFFGCVALFEKIISKRYGLVDLERR